ncbi:MAG: DUF2935 domain-containing protein [Christensenellales bacterium]|jgi:hypothetical protein
MLSRVDFVKQSLGLHLFFARIMKEHAFFLQAGFTPKDASFAQKADAFRKEFDAILAEAVSLSNGIVSCDILQSGEVITPFTLNAEQETSCLTGVQLATEITQAEARLCCGGTFRVTPMFEQRVAALNKKAIKATEELIQFKTNVLCDVLDGKMFTFNYPLLIKHIIREAELYCKTLKKLQNREEFNYEKEAVDQEFFWNRQMAEHAKFIRGLLDPTENELICQANEFGCEFDRLTAAAKKAEEDAASFARVTHESLKATKDLRNFKAQGTQGILNCNIKSIIIPLLGDHVLREANHYIRLLKTFERR